MQDDPREDRGVLAEEPADDRRIDLGIERLGNACAVGPLTLFLFVRLEARPTPFSPPPRDMVERSAPSQRLVNSRLISSMIEVIGRLPAPVPPLGQRNSVLFSLAPNTTPR